LDKRLKNREKTEEKQDVPIVEVSPIEEYISNQNPVIEDIKVNVSPMSSPSASNNNKTSFAPQNEKIPNKFFNFLEDESVNMSVEEPINLTEEIEMLDFDISLEPPKMEKAKDMTFATDLLVKLETELKNNNYTVNIIKDENNNEIKYSIIIDKN